MTGDSSEEIAAEFLDLRESDRSLTPEAFSARYDRGREEILAAIRAALEASDLLPSEDRTSSHPATVGPYDVVRVLGRGGMGVVYEVERDGARFAMKRLPLAPIVGPRLLERFRRESGILARLSHPNIVRVHDSGIADESPYFVMDLVDGPSLSEAAQGMSLPDKVRLAAILCRAAHAAHESGVVHRDLKPQNVVLRSDGSPVLLDFGLGAAEEFPAMTSTGDLLGTPRYMAPEQVRQGQADRRTDVYGLGMILYELVVGAPAYATGSRDQILDAVKAGKLMPPRRVARDLPPDLEKVILTAAASDPRHRFQTAAEMAEDLERFLAGTPVTARPPGAAVRAWQSLRRNPVHAAAALFAVAAGVAGAWLALDPGGVDPARLREANASFHRGVAHWLDGDLARAGDALGQALRANPAHASARALAVRIGAAPADEASATPLGTALDHFQAGRFGEVRPAVEAHLGSHQRDALTSAIVGLAALEARDFDRAEAELAAASADIPRSRRVAESRGRAQRRLRRIEDAVASYREALAIGPETPDLWLDLAEVYREQGDLDHGIQSAQAAARLAGTDSRRAARLLASLYNGKGDHARAQTILRGLLATNPKDVDAQFNLALSLDSAHAIVECEAAYRRVLALRRDHAGAMLCLANLYSGADRGHCKGCDQAYAGHPGFLRPEEAERMLIDALRLDAGKTKTAAQSALGIASRLPDKGRILVVLRELTEGKARSPAVLNLEWLLRRLELNEEKPASR